MVDYTKQIIMKVLVSFPFFSVFFAHGRLHQKCIGDSLVWGSLRFAPIIEFGLGFRLVVIGAGSQDESLLAAGASWTGLADTDAYSNLSPSVLTLQWSLFMYNEFFLSCIFAQCFCQLEISFLWIADALFGIHVEQGQFLCRLDLLV